ncbi:heavy-metal-associated domain-containing protein [Rhodothermus profundi]|uniref:Copper chaperone CopZ n=1 Tax=Rhodothermus profundi TaxID=633813 RepID=A0A1M6RME9_9BACT|nr:heavy-metal-associated domain-containing protein [Rhodothermus profundi]SHK33570.1 Copper chaperone CopZ [Rhodothermus profundi]
MRLRFRVASGLLVLWMGVGFLPAQGQTRVPVPDAILYVKGLACPYCAYGLEKKLKQLSMVREIEVQMDEGRVLVAFRKGQRPDPAAFEALVARVVKEAGFTLEKVEYPARQNLSRRKGGS